MGSESKEIEGCIAKEGAMKRHILVTAVSGDIANGILKILLEAGEEMVYGCDINKYAVGMDLVKVFFQCRLAEEKGYTDELLEGCRKYQITHLIVVNEREIEAVSQDIEKFCNAGIKVLIQAPHIVRICLDKSKTMSFLEDHDVSVPQTYLDVCQISWERGKALVVKPCKGNGSKEVTIVRSQEELRNLKLEGKLLQDYIEGDEYTVGIFRWKDGTVYTIVFKRILRAGFSYQVELVKDSVLEKLAKKIAELFLLEGYINIQLRKRKGKYYIFEINPRISGTVRFRHMLGFDDVLWWLDMMDDISAKPYKNRYEKAIGFRELNEKFVVLEEKSEIGGSRGEAGRF